MTRRYPSQDSGVAIVFDMDDTLYLERDYVRSGFRHVAEKVASTTGLAPRHIAAYLNHTLTELNSRGNNFDRLLERYPSVAQSWTIESLVREYRHHMPSIAMLPGMSSLLEELRALGAHLAIITDGFPEAQNRKLQALKAAGRVDKVIITDEYGIAFRKPNSYSYVHIMSYFQSDPAACIYIGDNPVKDFLAPRAMGWLTVRLRQRYQLHVAVEPPSRMAAPHIELHTVAQLRNLLIARIRDNDSPLRQRGVQWVHSSTL